MIASLGKKGYVTTGGTGTEQDPDFVTITDDGAKAYCTAVQVAAEAIATEAPKAAKVAKPAKAKKVAAPKAKVLRQSDVIKAEILKRAKNNEIDANDIPAILKAVQVKLPGAKATPGYVADIGKNSMTPAITVVRATKVSPPKGKRAAAKAKVQVAKKSSRKAKASVADVVAKAGADPLATAGDTAH